MDDTSLLVGACQVECVSTVKNRCWDTILRRQEHTLYIGQGLKTTPVCVHYRGMFVPVAVSFRRASILSVDDYEAKEQNILKLGAFPPSPPVGQEVQRQLQRV